MERGVGQASREGEVLEYDVEGSVAEGRTRSNCCVAGTRDWSYLGMMFLYLEILEFLA